MSKKPMQALTFVRFSDETYDALHRMAVGREDGSIPSVVRELVEAGLRKTG